MLSSSGLSTNTTDYEIYVHYSCMHIYIYVHHLATRPIQGVVFWALNFLRKVPAGAVLFKLMCSFRGIWLEDLWILSIDNFLERSLSQFLVHPKMTILRTSTLLSCVREILINLISDIAFDKNWNHFMCRALLEEPKKGKIKEKKKKEEEDYIEYKINIFLLS